MSDRETLPQPYDPELTMFSLGGRQVVHSLFRLHRLVTGPMEDLMEMIDGDDIDEKSPVGLAPESELASPVRDSSGTRVCFHRGSRILASL